MFCSTRLNMFLSNQHYFSLRRSKCSNIFVNLIAKDLQIEVHSKSLFLWNPWSVGKTMQSSQSAAIPTILTLPKYHQMLENRDNRKTTATHSLTPFHLIVKSPPPPLWRILPLPSYSKPHSFHFPFIANFVFIFQFKNVVIYLFFIFSSTLAV